MSGRAQICMVVVLMALSVGLAGVAVFKPSPFFGAYQVRLTSFAGTNTRTFSYPTDTQQLNSVGLALSGYDFRDMMVVQFQSQVSYDPKQRAFLIVLSLYNNTQFYFINYFVLAISQSGSSYFGVISTCIVPNVNPYDAFNNPGPSTAIVTSPFTKNSTNSIICTPFLKSIQSRVSDQYSYLNITQAIYRGNTDQITVQVYNNYSFLVEACVTVVVFFQSQAYSQLFLTTSLPMGMMVLSSDGQNTLLGSVAGNSFGIPYQYGPNLEPKCFLGLQTYFLNGKTRQTLNYNFSPNGVSQAYASSIYQLGYKYFCIAEIACSGNNMQYYPTIGDCQERCNILNCTLCSSSTSCAICQPTFFINALFRCSACSKNCQNCTNGNTCVTCFDGYFLNSSTCQICPLFCLKCTSQVCQSCQDGYIPVSNGCLACGSAMPKCLSCVAASICNLCETTYYFNSNAKGCLVCNDTMPNCNTCNLPNNCLTCYRGFYLAGINRCSPCSYNINACCSLYVANCSICKSNFTCSVCLPSFYLTSALTCSSCAIFGSNCIVCNANACVQCNSGYFPANNTCILCSSILPNCATCTNSSVCLTCQNSMIVVNNSCFDCPFWPINQLFYLNDMNQCQPCNSITPFCETCNSSITCLSCYSLYYLSDNTCLSCAEAIPKCSACSTPNQCEICESGYYLSLNQTQCLTCSSAIANCGQCGYIKNPAISLVCQICDPEYFPANKTCTSCDTSIPFCMQCSSPTICTVCASNYYLDSNHLCVDCPTILSGCILCKTAFQCLACASSYYLQNGFCMECKGTLLNCQKCIKNNGSQVTCTKCQDSYFFDASMKCSSCANQFTYCQNCTATRCSLCIPGYYISPLGLCNACSAAVPNCIYCSSNAQCLICNISFWLNTINNHCDTCNNISKGCASCERLNNSQMNCTACLNGYAIYAASNLVFSCLSCGVTIINCLSCSSSAVCLQCSNTSFLNQYNTCSLCSLYISNCETCINGTQCSQCKKSYQVIANGSCYYCDLAQFGVDSVRNPLCTKCSFQGAPICSTCTNGYYVNSQQSQCLSCGTAILNCAQCISNNLCISCSAGFSLSNDNTLCFACGIENCRTCSNGICTQCSQGSYMLPGTSSCEICNNIVAGCSSCSQNGCLGCTDGYYFQSGKCISCSSALPDCILCSSNLICDLMFTPEVPIPQSPLLKPIAISLIVLSIVLLAGLIIWWRISFFKKTGVMLQEDGPRADTDRRMTHQQVYTNEVQLDKGKICQHCLVNPSQVMMLQLLCSKCQLKLKRGHKHKIRKEILQKSNEEMNPYDLKLHLESKIDQVLEISNTTKKPSKREQKSRFYEQMSSRKATTRATNDLESQAIRNMF